MVYRKRWRPRRRYKRKYSRYSAASAIQKAFRRRRAKRRVFKAKKNFAVKKFNFQKAETLVKSFTIVCPDSIMLQPPLGYTGHGICTTNPGTAVYSNVFRLGILLRDSSLPNDVKIFSNELKNYLELYQQIQIMHGSVTMLRWNDGSINDGNTPSGAGTGPHVNSSIGRTGSKRWIGYVHSAIDSGQRHANNIIQNLSSTPAECLFSTKPDEYLANANSKFQQVSWDNKKSLKFKIIKPPKSSGWSQQLYTMTDTTGTASGTWRAEQPYIDTADIEKATNGTFTTAQNANYKVCYALGLLPPLSVYGTKFPIVTTSVGGVTSLYTAPIHKALVSITCRFRNPTTRNSA